MSRILQKKYIMRVIAVMVCIVTVGLLVLTHTTEAQAGDTLEGIKKILEQNTEGNRFLILEVVPDDAEYTATVSGLGISDNNITFDIPMGQLGYYVGGEEPIQLYDALTNFPNHDSRMKFLEQMKEALVEGQIWSAPSSNSITPLTFEDYDEAFSLSANDLIRAEAEGNPWTLIDYEGKNKYHTEMVSGNRMVTALNGEYTKNYSPSENGVSENVIDIASLSDNRALMRTVSGDGDFHPLFNYQDNGGYRVKFKKSNGSRGYQALEAVELNDGNIGSFGQNTLVYVKDVDDSFLYAGTVSSLSLSVSGASIGVFEETEDNDEENESEKKEPEKKEREMELFGSASSGKGTVGTGKGGNGVPGDKDEEDTMVEEVTPLDGVSVFDHSGDSNAVGSGYYVVRFGYSSDAAADSTYVYSVEDWDEETDAGATYFQDVTVPFVPNYSHTGSVISTGIRPLDFVYSFSENDEGIYYGNYTMVDDASITDKIRLSGVRVYYRGAFQNNEWFKKYVFDRSFDPDTKELIEDAYITVKTIRASEVANYEISQVGMIYFADVDDTLIPWDPDGQVAYEPYSASNDISIKAMMKVLGAVVDYDVPVMIDYSLTKSKAPNLQRLAKLLHQKDIATFYNANVSKSNSDIEKAADKAKDYFGSSGAIDGITHHVNSSVYIYNYVTEHQAQKALNPKFTQTFSDAIIAGAFDEIITEIQNENLYRETEGNENRIPETINEAVAIKYIISFKGRKSAYTKESLRILEIEPCGVPGWKDPFKKSDHLNGTFGNCTGSGHLYVDSRKLTSGATVYSLYREGNTNPILKDAPNKIEIVGMSTAEFIGHVEDLNSEYDMIYIGTNTCYRNTKTIKDATGRNRLGTYHNDKRLDGYVYTCMGDICYSNPLLSGWKSNFTISDSDDYYYSGNDLSSAKVEDLLDYLDAGYPVLVDDKCYEKGYVDSASRIYHFLEIAKQDYYNTNKNLFILDKDTTNPMKGVSTRFSWYLNLAKPQIELDGGVTKTDICQEAYKEGDEYYMKYAFDITNKGSANEKARFDCKLYIDVNSDGKYSPEVEDQDSMVIKNAAGEEQQRKDGLFSLKPGVTYYISYQISDDFTGPIPWKLEVTQNDKITRRDSVIGCYTIHRPGDQAEVNVLQIGPSTKYKCSEAESQSWNLQDQYENNRQIFDTHFRDMIDGVGYYKMTFKTVTIDEYVNWIKSNNSNADLSNYNLLILGFGRFYNLSDYGTSSDAAYYTQALNRIVDYATQGKSILVTNDTFSRSAVSTKAGYVWNVDGGGKTLQYWNFDFTKALRNFAGMDRYGVAPNTQGSKDVAHPLNDSNSESKWTQGLAVGSLLSQVSPWWNSRSNVRGVNENVGFLKYSGSNGGEMNYMSATGVTKQMNKGQITLYPNQLDESFANMETVLPYYQLDFEIDSDLDNEKDVVVWYSIDSSNGTGNSILDYDGMDARNMYYVYSKGNITYYGAHSMPYNRQELNLFVNTAVAAYEAGAKAPQVKFIERADISSRKIETSYIPYDKLTDSESIEGLTQDIYFYARRSKASEELMANFYFEVPTGTAGSEVIRVNGADVSVIKLDATTLSVKDGKTDVDCPIVTRDIDDEGHQSTGRAIEAKVPYKIAVPLSILNNKNSGRLYVRVTSTIPTAGAEKTAVQNAFDSVNLVKTELFNLD